MLDMEKFVLIRKTVCEIAGIECSPVSAGTVSMLNWFEAKVTAYVDNGHYPKCDYFYGAAWLFFITSMRPFRSHNLVTTLCYCTFIMHHRGIVVSGVSQDEGLEIIARVKAEYKSSPAQAAITFAQEYRYWLYIHSKETPLSDMDAMVDVRAAAYTGCRGLSANLITCW